MPLGIMYLLFCSSLTQECSIKITVGGDFGHAAVVELNSQPISALCAWSCEQGPEAA